jgi:hypothetical protein
MYMSYPQSMLTEIYIEAQLVDEELADQVWKAWDRGPTQQTINSVES